MPDPRQTLAHNGIAEGIIPATRYIETTMRQTQVPSASLRRAPSPGAEQLDQLLFGERFEMLGEADGWAFGQAVRDGYVGYVETGALGGTITEPTHRVRALRTYGFSAPSIKAAPANAHSSRATPARHSTNAAPMPISASHSQPISRVSAGSCAPRATHPQPAKPPGPARAAPSAG